MRVDPILLRARGTPDSQSLTAYLAAGGYNAWEKVLQMTPEAVTAEVTLSELRGRGGAGFPTGRKWSFIPKDHPGPRYLVCNADESEPGTFKDRELIEHDPHLVVEGIAIAAFAIKASTAFVYIRGEFVRWAKILERAIAEARNKGYLGKGVLGSGYSLEIVVHRGAGAYICGEETALIESIEGKRGFPRLKPPFPAVAGLFGKPTIVNNVETLACLPHIINRGAKWFASIGRPRNTGPKLFCVSGHVQRPGVVELPLGVPFREIIFEHCGGIRDGRELKAFFPGGSSAPILSADQLDVRADFDACAEAGSMLGSGGVIVLDDTVDIVEAAANLAHFYAHESCGQCTPCREGSDWAVDILERILDGHGRPGDLELLQRICTYASGGMTICPLGDAFALPIASMVKKFAGEFERRIAAATPSPPRKKPVLPWSGPSHGFGR
ncbi:MAG TPA: NADH-quinone oxidoreductase subunit NuoF [Thermoanaerobaculaceae bacterium]|nr:NADH-quinone oxidoreductase subunit NuoF [Thermoanaerobaculaceae bacterium]HRS17069.1 NADH-quinone oxidoreductase subunit NuoF [Thermoanaerobaculaceae bacterium]